MNAVIRIRERQRDQEAHPTRIAVLDTGIDTEYSGSKHVKSYKDFVSNTDDTYHDSTGHGTAIFHVMQKTYNSAEFYIGRVWEKATMTDQTPVLMSQVRKAVTAAIFIHDTKRTCQAINHAREVWNVEVIVIPSGFRDEYEAIRRAIEAAKHSGILIFAAASNYGNMTRIAFPGRLYRFGTLFCMFSTNAEARCFPHFNPTAEPNAVTPSFAVLGQNIAIPRLEKPLSGTSYSTAIGAALAGQILDFARHPDCRTRIRRGQHLSRVEGMSAVFSKMSRQGLDNGYTCMVPWELLPFDNEDLEGRDVQRGRICDTISTALESIF